MSCAPRVCATQATGEKLNELTEMYYKAHPRGYDDPWPQEKYIETDAVLRRILTDETEALPKEVVRPLWFGK